MNLDLPTDDRADIALAGKTHWRSLDELANTPAFRTWVEHTFPQSMRELLDGAVDRRRFLYLLAASLGLAGLSGCRRPVIAALPYSKPPEDIVPGLPTYYATAMPRPGTARPVLVECHEGRPTKVEGNPLDPAVAGGTDVFAQASVLDLYDPDRAREVLRAGVSSTWERYDAFAATHFAGLRARNGQGLRVLCGDTASPAFELLRDHIRDVMPEARWHTYEPAGLENARAGAMLAFGSSYATRVLLDRAAVVVTLDADILGVEDDGGRHVREFAAGRRQNKPGDPMNRLYAVESRYSITGGMADHRLRLPSSQVADYTLALTRAVLLSDPVVPVPGSPAAALRNALVASRPALAVDERWVRETAADLRAHAGRSVVVAGRRQPALVHALAQALNATLANVGKTVELRDGSRGKSDGTLRELVDAIGKKEVETLVVLGGNPGYDAPVDLEFAAAWKSVATTIRLGQYVDETSAHASWHLPEAHYLESWGDARAGDGTLLPIQPMIEPLFGGRTALEVLARLSAFETTVPYEIVRLAFRKASGVATVKFEAAWRSFLHDGMLKGSALPPTTPALRSAAIARAVAASKPSVALSAENLELVFDRDARVDDGRFANNGWLQEVPDPITKLTWDNAALLSPQTAQALGVETGDLIRLEINGRGLEIVALAAPGQADFSIAVALGYGRPSAGRVGRGVGFNAYAVRTSDTPDIAIGVKLTKTGGTYPLSSTQHHFTMEGRDLVRELTLAELTHPPAQHPEAPPAGEILSAPKLEGEHQWGMTIDLNTCVGCNVCSIACQSENNIPIVGKGEVARGREMHWIRIDRYFAGDRDDPRLVHQPVACMQCENAPCEVVCPVNATVHDEEGLNVQVYSRCIGTRYCLDNCPYKVRRFNFFDFNERPLDQLRLGPLAAKGMAETLKMQKNPDVTVRMRGVMEKCTYCVQRIERGKIGARVAAGDAAQAKVPDGTIVPACAQACPAQAIVFGDVSDPASRVSRLKAQTRDYALLGELNTRPRTTYLARLRNPNPKMPAPAGEQA